MKRIALVGCTGNIGGQVLDVVRRNATEFCISALVAGHNERLLQTLTVEFKPTMSRCAARNPFRSIEEAAEIFQDADVAFIAAGGFSGLFYTLAAIRAKKKIALANKESLVCGGELVMRAAREQGVEIVPVDSEHSAIFQALSFCRETPFSKLVLTASGGPFLHSTEEELSHVTAADALRHPTWNMGAKITVDSATLLNKGYEIIEAKWLYGADFSKIEAVVHPESIVHSLVYFEDGAAIAQLGYPDMRVPIQLALTYPARRPCSPQLDLVKLGALHFERLPQERFPCFGLAIEAGRAGGIAPTVLNGAAEEAVYAFLKGSISFGGIAETIEGALSVIPNHSIACYDDLLLADALARKAAKEHIYGK